jgi:Zn-finger nucleic acid-binding protein
MPDSWDDRKRALEEDYFHRKEKEAIERMRAKRAAEGAAAGLQCPRCDGMLMEIDYEVVKIDRCEKCNGVWLDSGELEQLTKQEDSGGFLGRMFGSFSRK